MVTPLAGTWFAVKLALNQRYVPAGTKVPLKFEELVAVATHGGGGGGVVGEQATLLPDMKVIGIGPLVSVLFVAKSSAVPDNV